MSEHSARITRELRIQRVLFIIVFILLTLIYTSLINRVHYKLPSEIEISEVTIVGSYGSPLAKIGERSGRGGYFCIYDTEGNPYLMAEPPDEDGRVALILHGEDHFIGLTSGKTVTNIMLGGDRSAETATIDLLHGQGAAFSISSRPEGDGLLVLSGAAHLGGSILIYNQESEQQVDIGINSKGKGYIEY